MNSWIWVIVKQSMFSVELVNQVWAMDASQFVDNFSFLFRLVPEEKEALGKFFTLGSGTKHRL